MRKNVIWAVTAAIGLVPTFARAVNFDTGNAANAPVFYTNAQNRKASLRLVSDDASGFVGGVSQETREYQKGDCVIVLGDGNVDGACPAAAGEIMLGLAQGSIDLYWQHGGNKNIDKRCWMGDGFEKTLAEVQAQAAQLVNDHSCKALKDHSGDAFYQQYKP